MDIKKNIILVLLGVLFFFVFIEILYSYTYTDFSYTACRADFNCDGKVDSADESLIMADYGRSKLVRPCNTTNPCK